MFIDKLMFYLHIVVHFSNFSGSLTASNWILRSENWNKNCDFKNLIPQSRRVQCRLRVRL